MEQGISDGTAPLHEPKAAAFRTEEVSGFVLETQDTSSSEHSSTPVHLAEVLEELTL